ncbi:MAG: citrate synthase [Deltaproteobacteria bacterium]|nr:citrate synthase [Deltaproteobacteria bacterium]
MADSKKDICRIELGESSYELPVVVGSEGERGIDISSLRSTTGHIALDRGYMNTGSCVSSISYIDGEQGILRYRGIAIEDLAEKSTFVETAYLVIYGELPTASQLKEFSAMFTKYEMLHEGLKHHFEGFPPNAHPMAILSSMINAMGCYEADIADSDQHFDEVLVRIMSKVRTIAAFSYKKSIGEPFIYPYPEFSYCANLLHMMFSVPYKEFFPSKEAISALNKFFILHADHEQNCSTSTVRMVASSKANLFASIAAGVCSLWGPLHGGANMAVIEMLDQLYKDKTKTKDFVAQIKDSTNKTKLMGFGHRVYKNHDPRAKIIKKSCDELLSKLKINDPTLEIAKELEEIALQDEYFISRKLYPNVDFYSGIILRALGIPANMFTVMFAIGRIPGWIAQWREENADPKGKICRPRQIYNGQTSRPYKKLADR